MNYANYDEKVVLLLEVKLVGWPLERPLCSPSDIGNAPEMRQLRNALKSGACKWARLTAGEVKAHTDEIEMRRKKGEVVGKPRKRRSDAGAPRAKRQRAADKENQGPPAKKQKKNARASTSKMPTAAGKKSKAKAYTSRPFVVDEDEDEDNEDNEDDDE